MYEQNETASGTVTHTAGAHHTSPAQEQEPGPLRFKTQVEARVSGEQMPAGYSQIMNELNQVDVRAIGETELAWKRAAEILQHIAIDLMPKVATMLDEAWTSEASVKAQKHLQVAQGTVTVLAENCSAMQTTVGWAHEQAEKFTAIENRPPASGSLTVTDARTGALTDDQINNTYADRYRNNQAASEYLGSFMQGYSQAATALPSAVVADIPPALVYKDSNIYRETSDSAVDAHDKVSRTGGVSGSSAGGAAPRTVSTGGTVPAGSTAALADPFSTDGAALAGAGGLAGLGGVTPGPTPGSEAGNAGSAWGLGAGSAGAAGIGALGARALGLGGAGGSGAAPGGLWGRSGGSGMTSATGKSVVTPETLSNGRGTGAGAGTGAAAGRSGAGAGGVMAPMGGAGQGSEDEERERESWLVEEDAWNIVIDAPPSIISE